MTITTDRGKMHEIQWCTGVMSPDELWVRLPQGVKIADIAADFDGCAVFTVKHGEEKEQYEGYMRLINASEDRGGLTLRMSKEMP